MGSEDSQCNLSYTELVNPNITLGDYSLNQTSHQPESAEEGATSNAPFSPTLFAYPLTQLVVISAAIGFLILFTILGNVFVIAAILLEKSLRNVQNYLILSLAVTDLMVAVLVMPLSLFNEVSSEWYLGNQLCDMWVSFDVLCCTASILHLVAIAGDRYLAVSRIDYIRKRNWQKIGFMILTVWLIAAAVSIPPLFGWRNPSMAPENSGLCVISQDLGYTLFSTGAAFYFPMMLMLLLNYKIYATAKWRIQKRRTLKNSFHRSEDKLKDSNGETVCGYAPQGKTADIRTIELDNVTSREPAVAQKNTVSQNACLIRSKNENFPVSPAPPDQGVEGAIPRQSTLNSQNGVSRGKRLSSRKLRQLEGGSVKRERFELRRERKAARVLGIITGVFIACWLPFFTLAVVGPFCGLACNIPLPLVSFFLWLGYLNSLLNPLIYTIFNHHFRNAFNKMFSGEFCRVKQYR